jgi:hypothetical protein
LGNFDWDDQTIYHDITDTSEISTADDNISDIDNAEINGSTSSDDRNVMESGNDYLQGIVPLLESSTIAIGYFEPIIIFCSTTFVRNITDEWNMIAQI